MTTYFIDTNLKRAAGDILIDPDTQKQIKDSKRPKVELDAARKYNCISAVVKIFEDIVASAFKPLKLTRNQLMDNPEYNITVGNHIMTGSQTNNY